MKARGPHGPRARKELQLTTILNTVYHLKLTDTVSGEFRIVSVAASSLDEAEAIVMAQEAKKVGFQITDSGELSELFAKQAEGSLSGREKGRLFAHMQEKPYKIQKAKEADA